MSEKKEMDDSSSGQHPLALRCKEALKVTWIGFCVNLVLSLLKLIAGIVGRSAAMVSDAIHTISDLLGDIIVLIGVRLGARPIDSSHDYGHGKFETLTAALIGLLVLVIGVGLLYSAAAAVAEAVNGDSPARPGWIALAAALLSIVIKEIIYRYTLTKGHSLNSKPLVANAWHHRSDALSSVGTLAGIAGAIFLARQWTVLDPIAAIIVAGFIVRVGASFLWQGVQELLDASLPEAVEQEMAQLIGSVSGVSGHHQLRTRAVGTYFVLEVHVLVDRKLSIVEGHDIATRVENTLRERYGAETLVSIHIEPEGVRH